MPIDEELIRVEYHPGALLAGEEFVVLRCRFRTAEEQAPSATLGEEFTISLGKQEDGVFSGSVGLPLDVVYLAAVVEDVRGESIDTNGGRLWDLLRHETYGKPQPEAYRQQFLVWQQKRFDVARKPAEDLVAAYPNRPESWLLLLFQQQISGSFDDSAALEHQRRLAQFTEVLDRDRMSVDDLAALASYARRLQDDIRYQELDEALQRRFPLHRTSVNHRMLRDRSDAGTQSEHFLQHLEREWQVSGFSHHNLAVIGWQRARDLHDPFAMRLWSDRYLKVRPFDAADVAVSYGAVSELLADGVARLKRELSHLGDGYYLSFRPLEITKHEFSNLLEQRAQKVLEALGITALAGGDTASAIAYSREATDKLWAPDLFEAQARLALLMGDTARAISLLARLYVDPLVDLPNDLAQEFAGTTTESAWEAEIRLAMINLRGTLRAVRSPARRLPPFLVRDEADISVKIPETLIGRVAVVFLWSRADTLGLERSGWLEAVSTLEDHDIRAVTIVDAQATPKGFPDLPTHAQGIPLLYDPNRNAARAFGSWAIRPLFIVDGDGYIRYRAVTVEDAIRHAIAIGHTAQLTA
ncbi:MAG: hypothetical protein ABFS14_06210 [Gemmatimonadota bacterium]